MTNHFARLWNRVRLAPAPLRTSEGDPIVISPDARVSLDQNGAVFLHARRGIVFTSNRIGALIWQGLVDREAVETIAARISREGGAGLHRVRQDTTQFIADLETHGFLFRRIGY